MDLFITIAAGAFGLAFIAMLAKVLFAQGRKESKTSLGGGGSSEPEPRQPGTVTPPGNQDAA
jgi:hypothetical protein